MESDGKAISGIMLGVSIPPDSRFSETIRALSTRLATYVGYAEGDACVIGESVQQAALAIAQHAPGPSAAGNVEIRFTTAENQLDVRILFVSDRAASARSTPADVEQRLTGGHAGGADLDRIRRVMHVEFGSEGDRDFCRLLRALPVSI